MHRETGIGWRLHQDLHLSNLWVHTNSTPLMAGQQQKDVGVRLLAAPTIPVLPQDTIVRHPAAASHIQPLGKGIAHLEVMVVIDAVRLPAAAATDHLYGLLHPKVAQCQNLQGGINILTSSVQPR